MSTVNEKDVKPVAINSEIEWSAENEVHLFYAMRGHKPVGVARNFHMLCVLDAFVSSTTKEVSSNLIWNHLSELYDMETLHDNEDIPFPNINVDFTIEDNQEFEEMIAKKVANSSNKSDKNIENLEQNETERNAVPNTKSAQKNAAHSKTNEVSKTNSKIKSIETEKNARIERKDDVKEKAEESDEKSHKTKKQVKPNTPNVTNKKRKTNI